MSINLNVFIPTAAEHVLKYVKEGYSYVNEFEEDCAADDKVCDYIYSIPAHVGAPAGGYRF